MKTASASTRLVRPASLQHALQALSGTPSLMPLAGCTDVYVAAHFGTLDVAGFIDIRGLRELRGIEVTGDTLRFGALCTYSEILAEPAVHERLPMLVSACREIGGVQIRNRGTIGGNVANGSPAGDTLPVLAAAEATLVLVHHDGERRVPFDEFHTGYRTNVLRPGELIAAIEVPAVEGRQWFRKVGTRAAQAIAKVVIAAVHGARPRVAIGSVAPVVLRLRLTEAAIAAGADIDHVIDVMQGEITPIDDIRSSAAYRRAVAANLLRRFLDGTAP
jgi:xanthine dehydrogenase small subunit